MTSATCCHAAKYEGYADPGTPTVVSSIAGVHGMAGVRMEVTHVGLVADGETIEIRSVLAPNIFGDAGVFRCQAWVGAGARVKQTYGVDHLHSGGLSELKEVVDVRVRWSGRDTVLAGAGTIHCASADTNVFDPDVPEQGNELRVRRSKEIARDSVGVQCHAFRFKTQAYEVIGNSKLTRCGIYGQVDWRLRESAACEKRDGAD